MITLPECSEDKISADLVYLTEVLSNNGADISGGLLGGRYGYGAYYENDVFMMHPYCWCEQDDCKWCNPCLCDDDSYEVYVEGVKISNDEYFAIDDCRGLDVKFVNIPENQCNRCRNEIESAPNFLHKPSGTNIKWYKYIGRDMEISLYYDWVTIFNECLESIKESS